MVFNKLFCIGGSHTGFQTTDDCTDQSAKDQLHQIHRPAAIYTSMTQRQTAEQRDTETAM